LAWNFLFDNGAYGLSQRGLGERFLKPLKEIHVPHMNHLMFMSETKTCGVLMVTRRKLGWMPRISSMRLIKVVGKPMDMPQVAT